MWRDALSFFCCNKDDDITDFINKKAIEYEKRDKCPTYIYFDENYLQVTGKLKIIGYFSIAMKTSSMLGNVGEGFKICMWQLNNTRISCAAGALGVGGAALEAAVKYANERTQFGQKLASFQMIKASIAEMAVEHQAAQLLVYRAAWLKDQGLPNQYETSIGKYFSAESAVHLANEAMKILGSYGYSSEYPAERYLRDAKSFQVVEGTSNIQKLIIADITLGESMNR